MRITIDIKDSQAPFLIELLEQLNYVSIIQEEHFEVPEWHKEVVMARVNDPKATYTSAEDFFENLDKEIL